MFRASSDSKEKFGETSYQVIRWVFRRYNQFRRTICTSVSLRTSTRVSLDSSWSVIVHHLSGPSMFILARLFTKDLVLPVMHTSPKWSAFLLYSISLCWWVFHSKTCEHVRLPGPCFKTGEITPSNATSLTCDQKTSVTTFDTANGFHLTTSPIINKHFLAKQAVNPHFGTNSDARVLYPKIEKSKSL